MSKIKLPTSAYKCLFRLMREEKYDSVMINRFIDIQEAERKRISMDLHDSLAQEISMIRMYLNLLKKISQGSKSVTKISDEMDELLKKVIHSIRDISHNLSPKIIESYCIFEALGILINRIRFSSETKIEFKCEPGLRINSKTNEKHIYRIFQEFIHNSLKHSNATKIQVEIRHLNNEIQFAINDNGEGFDINAVYHSIGISNIQMRLKAIGAKYMFVSTPGIGTELKININEKNS